MQVGRNAKSRFMAQFKGFETLQSAQTYVQGVDYAEIYTATIYSDGSKTFANEEGFQHGDRSATARGVAEARSVRAESSASSIGSGAESSQSPSSEPIGASQRLVTRSCTPGGTTGSNGNKFSA